MNNTTQPFTIFLCLFLLIATSCQPTELATDTPAPRVIAENGMVVTAHTLASKVGADILKSGGNAFDAAIAVQYALAVVYPRAGNIAGGGFMVYRKADGELGTLDFREKASKAAHSKMYLDEEGKPIENASLLGHLAVGVPGTVDGMVKIHEKFGSKPMADLIQPAIDLAAKGFPVTEPLAELLNKHKDIFIEVNSTLPKQFVKDDLWKKGDLLKQTNLANTLTLIRDNGRDGFYKGQTADLIVKEMENGKGIITTEDLEAYQAIWRKPVTVPYKNYKIISMPPPSSGGVALAQMMKATEAYPIQQWGHNSVKTLHAMTEIERRVYADRATHLGDPDFYEVPVDMLLEDEYLKERMSNISMTEKTPSSEIKEGKVEVIESIETTHFSVADKAGNAVSITTTLNGYFGCKVVVSGAGFFLNNEMDDFSIKPGVPNQFGLIGGEANSIKPEKRMLSSMTPTIVEKDGKLLLVLGSPGGSTIITSVYQVILNVIEHQMPIQEAVNARRTHHQWLPDRILEEADSLPHEVSEGLRQLGHTIEHRNNPLGKIEAILMLPDGRMEGGADYTRGQDDKAIGY